MNDEFNTNFRKVYKLYKKRVYYSYKFQRMVSKMLIHDFYGNLCAGTRLYGP